MFFETNDLCVAVEGLAAFYLFFGGGRGGQGFLFPSIFLKELAWPWLRMKRMGLSFAWNVVAGPTLMVRRLGSKITSVLAGQAMNR